MDKKRKHRRKLDRKKMERGPRGVPDSTPAVGVFLTPDDRKYVGQKLRQIRIDHGWRQKDVKKRCGISTGTIASIERGYESVSRRNLDRYAIAIGTTIPDIIHAERRPQLETLIRELPLEQVIPAINRALTLNTFLLLLARRLEEDPSLGAKIRPFLPPEKESTK